MLGWVFGLVFGLVLGLVVGLLFGLVWCWFEVGVGVVLGFELVLG